MMDLSFISTVAILGTPILLLVMLLPAVLELKKPRDAGPRLIMDDSSLEAIQVLQVPLIWDIEENHGFDFGFHMPTGLVFGFLGNLDA
jgi:hypothetical protein